MVEANRKEYEFCNIPQWVDALKDAPPIKFLNLEDDKHQKYHGLKVEKVMLEDLTNVEEFNTTYSKWTTNNIEKTIDDCIVNGVHLIISSLLIKSKDQAYQRAFSKARANNIFIIQAAGNDNENIDGTSNIGNFEDIITIGAVHLYEKIKPVKKDVVEKASYSNKGNCLDYTDFSNLEIEKEMLKGTSFSQPFLAKKLILVLKYFLLNNIPIIYDDVISFIDSNLYDLGESGKDLIFGKGLFILPDINALKLEGDNMSHVCRDLNELLPYVKTLAEQLLQKCKEQNIPIIITETYRSQERQNELYAQGRTTPGQVVTWTKNSKHKTRRAFDFAKLINGQTSWDNCDGFFEKVGKIGKSIGLTWGGSWSNSKDLPHFQYDGEIPKDNNLSPIKMEDDDMIRYARLIDIPNDNGFQDIIKVLMDAKIVNGDGSDTTGNNDIIDLSIDQIRMIIMQYRGGAFDRRFIELGYSPVVKI